ncbi:cocaine- and amphetamine-regulated transcript protein-like [Pyxicephalus adspersus]|uniref:Cocaine- and amphetamine-regulated transcript protein n=1 Tax=Pyxicephalus adspersus TaxID=30357 RepID=A0AAV3B7V2_PYXAD|nr:TPA: hypothetical protein GDO54_007608 [Pyxicephalus adspersus]
MSLKATCPGPQQSHQRAARRASTEELTLPRRYPSSTMNSSALLLQLLCASVLLFCLCQGQSSREISSEDFDAKKIPTSSEKELVEAMEELLGKFQDRYPVYQKRAQIPMCDIGERCAVKQGPRIGKLCDCSRGSSCNSFLLKCI